MFDRENFEAGMFDSFPLSENHANMPRHRRVINALGQSGVMADAEAKTRDEFVDSFHTFSGLALIRILNNAHQRSSILSVARYYAPDFWMPTS